MSETVLREALESHLDDLDIPVGDVFAAMTRGRRRHAVRTAVSGVAVAAAFAAVIGAGAAVMTSEPDSRVPDTTGYADLGELDLGQGARAYADPGNEIHLGGRTFPAEDLGYLDTDAVATGAGVVFFDAGRPMLLGADGKVVALVAGDLDAPRNFHPTAKADSQHPWVVWATRVGGETTLTVYDLEQRREVASTTAPCGACGGLVIDAFDAGVAYVRMGDETQAWSSDNGTWEDFAGQGSSVADVRNGVVLYAGKPPTSALTVDGQPMTQVQGPIDAQLTFDGRYVLSWSSRLEPVRTRQAPLILEKGPTDIQDGPAFYNLDSDGSILVATLDGADYPEYTVYDCEVPSGTCSELGPLNPTGGDPQFLGNDM